LVVSNLLLGTPTDYSSSVAGLNHQTPGQGQLLFVEASRSKGCGKLTVTGQLGEVMLESVKTAM
jgi:ATP-dependent Lon protease